MRARPRGAAPPVLAATALVVMLAVAVPVHAQEAVPGARKSAWKRGLELAGSLFVGNKPQTVLTTRGRASHRDSTFELSLDARFTYGESYRDSTTEVSQRNWLGNVTLDLWPHAGHSPFLLTTIESSFERRIDLRINGGVGHKMTFVNTPEALANLSLAMLGEHSRLPDKEGAVITEELTRLSARLRLRRRVGGRTELSHESFFRPELHSLTRYTFSNSTSAGYKMNDMVALKVSYLDNYDSEARGRGAESNYDGQLVVGVQADF
jgi:hypothetical protein